MNKIKKISLLPLLVLGLAACNKKEVIQLNFDVKPEKTSYRVGETVNFLITGNPDQVLFYSGEEGRKYIYKDRTQAQSDNITLEFATNRRYGLDAQQPNSLRLLASQTFNGKYDAANVNPADWVDITSAFTLSGIQSTDVAYVSSGIVNLTTLSSLGFTLDKSKPVYFAFKYTGVTGTTQPRWWVNKFDVKTTTTDGQVLPVASIASATWTPVKVLTTSPVNWTFGTDLILKFQGGGTTTGSNQVWAISGGLSLTKVQPDAGVALKNMSTRMDNYTYKYTAAGTYTVTFVAANVNVYGESKSVKEVQVVVTP
ncbi:DUF5017 domain-containing protein [Nubsella zeaxanthinifaciens]|uniref:DUF5017 domain-containing protein n=1 Tax=Nubsella zeaxanthinifaciens TaxID=392412 RepID=UPI000DE32C7B|nr:DUF5017 domain-containing protein [Nubsella zeaxanthinifaciens]